MGFMPHRGFESRPLRPRAARYTRDAASRGPAPVAQLDRASVYGTEGHRFESCRARFGKPRSGGVFSSSIAGARIRGPWVGTRVGTELLASELRGGHRVPTPDHG